MKKLPLLLAAAIGLAAAGAHAQASETERKVARDLGNQGIDLYEKGDYPGALDKLERAYAVLRAHTLGLWLARALAKNGKLVEASERYLEVVRAPLPATAPQIFRDAQADADKENQALQARIPTLAVSVEGADAASVAMAVDGKPIKSAMLGIPLPLNPGERVVEGRLGEQVVTQTVTLQEGSKESVTLQFAAAPAAAPVAAPAAAPGATQPVAAQPAAAQPAPPQPAGTPAQDTGASDGSTQRIIGWIGLGAGGVGLVVGGVTGMMVLSKKSELDDSGCVDNGCPYSVEDERNSYNSLRNVSGVSFIVGGLLAGAGAVLLLTAPSGPEETTAGITPFVGLGSAGVQGVF